MERTIPEDLRSISPQNTAKGHQFVLWAKDSIRVFDDWWEATEWRRENVDKTIAWDLSRLSADCWKHFKTIARQDGKPFILCSRCNDALAHPYIRQSGNSTPTRHLQTTLCQKAAKFDGHGPIVRAFKQQDLNNAFTASAEYSPSNFIEQTLRVVAALRLPFRALENLELRKWIVMAWKAPKSTIPTIPQPNQARLHLQDQVLRGRKQILGQLPRNVKISLAVDCWTSPNQHAFMAVTGNFIDMSWTLREVLLGFEHVQGRHTGHNLAQVFRKCLEESDISLSQVLTITSDNAANNRTMITHLEDAMKIISNDIQMNKITHAPCLSHVIQLALVELIQTIRIGAKNSRIITEWDPNGITNEDHSDAIEGDGAPWTLKKLRSIVIAINASPQRREIFRNYQSRTRTLCLIQDVRTRWNSTLRMIRRARKLREAVDRFTTAHPEVGLSSLTCEEWKHIDYLIEILSPFSKWTDLIGRTTNGPTIHTVFDVYNSLFSHIEDHITKLTRKRLPWKRMMLTALQHGETKLRSYYSKTQEAIGYIYGVATILAPQYKLRFFEEGDWQEDLQWRDRYHKQFSSLFNDYAERLAITTERSSSVVPSTPSLSRQSSQDMVFLSTASSSLPSSSPPTPQSLLESSPTMVIDQRQYLGKRKTIEDLSTMLARKRKKPKPSSEHTDSHITAYLKDKINFGLDDEEVEQEPLKYWKRAEKQWPVIAAMARDYLAIPAAGVGVERLFNSARDICSYRRHNLKPHTLKLLMMLMCFDKFAMREEFRVLTSTNELEDSLDSEDRTLNDEEDEEDNASDDDRTTGLISDDEEFEDTRDIVPSAKSIFDFDEEELPATPPAPQGPLGLQRRHEILMKRKRPIVL